MSDQREMTEQNGKIIATLAGQLLDEDLDARSIVVVVGCTQRGAAALAAVQYLWERGAWVQTVCAFPTEACEEALSEELERLKTLGLPFAWAEEGWELPACDLLIEAISQPLPEADAQGREREVILLANSSAAPILSIEVPSGVNAATGQRYFPHIEAAATLLLDLEQATLSQPPLSSSYGTLYRATTVIL